MQALGGEQANARNRLRCPRIGVDIAFVTQWPLLAECCHRLTAPQGTGYRDGKTTSWGDPDTEDILFKWKHTPPPTHEKAT